MCFRDGEWVGRRFVCGLIGWIVGILSIDLVDRLWLWLWLWCTCRNRIGYRPEGSEVKDGTAMVIDREQGLNDQTDRQELDVSNRGKDKDTT